MNTASHIRFRNMGLGGGADSAVQAGAVVGQAASTAYIGATIGGTTATILGMSAAVAIPVVGAAIAALSIGIEAILHSGCGQTCIVTSQWANQAGAALDQNIKEWFAIKPPRPISVQRIALANFQAIWNELVAKCNQPGLGDAGQRCINDRKDGACKWKAAPPAYPGEPAAGECWNWWNAYYYPIANDPNVYDDSAPVPGSALTTGILSAVGGSGESGIDPHILIGLALVGAAIAVHSL